MVANSALVLLLLWLSTSHRAGKTSVPTPSPAQFHKLALYTSVKHYKREALQARNNTNVKQYKREARTNTSEKQYKRETLQA